MRGHWNGKRLLAMMMVGAMLLSGCGGGAKDQSEQPTNPLNPQMPVTITLWNYYNGEQLAAFTAIVEEFNTTAGRELGIVVEGYSQGSVGDLETNVLAAAQGKVGAGEVPNIFAAYADTAYAVDQMDLVADIAPYFTQEELDAYVDSYVEEGRFSADGSIKIFPVAKSTEVLMLNITDWERFAADTGARYEELATMEGLVATAEAYYHWSDALTPAANDGKAFFGRDALANYMLIGAMQLGTQIFRTENGKMVLDFDKETVRQLWDHFYVPYIKGYFAATGRFRSDDIKTGHIISLVGSSSGATFFPEKVVVDDTTSYEIETIVLPNPQFAKGEPYAVQQGAGMVVTKNSEAEVYASVAFLKWFTQQERNIAFSVSSGYLPVTKVANDMTAILAGEMIVSPMMEKVLQVAVDTVNNHKLYTPKAFEGGTSARSVLEYAMIDAAKADRAVVQELLAQGSTLEQATAEYTSDANFEAWYAQTLVQLEAFTG